MKTKFLLIALLAQFINLSASAYTAKIGSIYFDLNTSNKTATVTYYSTSYNSYSGQITIPTTITYNDVRYKVTAIGYSAFYNCSGLTSVSIPSSITSIGADAFYNCDKLTSVTIPASVTSIGRGAFNDCDGLTSVTIPASVKKIDYRTFYFCSKLASVSIPSSVTLIENEAFDKTPWRTSWLAEQQDGPCYINSVLYTYKGTMPEGTSVVVENGTTGIAGGAFNGRSNLVSVDIPQSVTSIGSYAFSGCGLTSVSLPTALTYLGSAAFLGCTALNTIDIPAFTETGGYSSYTSPISGYSSNGNSGYFIFAGCSSLTSATLAEGMTRVYIGMFVDCTNLTTVTLPSTITSISASAFRNCENLSTVKVGMQEPFAIDSEVFTNRFLATLIVPEGCKEAYQNAEFWEDFLTIVEEGDIEQCATPSIAYSDGKLTFGCKTEGVQFASTITDDDIRAYNTEEVELCATYAIQVIATKPGLGDSKAATATLCWLEQQPDIHTDVLEANALPVLIQTQGSTISVQGAVDGTPISIYGIDGKECGSSIAAGGSATIATSLQPGSVAVVRIGEKAVKVLLK